MANGHARGKHGAELGDPSRAAYQRRVARHLLSAPIAFAVTGGDGLPRYFLGDPAGNQAAWITPHKERRSTFFQPRNGVTNYVRAQHRAKPAERWATLNIDAIRTRAREVQRAAMRQPARRRPHGRQLDR